MDSRVHDRAVEIYDTTLRDGTQREGLSLSCDDKLRIARRLDAFGVDYIEGGFPGSNPKDQEFFRRARGETWAHARIVAFGATRRAGIEASQDPNLVALVEAGAPVAAIFGKTSLLHVREILRVTPQENLDMIGDSVAFLVGAGLEVVYDAEHFFDGFLLDADYAIRTLLAAERAGASRLVLCDTNGGTLPWDVESIVARVCAAVSVPVGIHAHNDAGCAVANSLAAVRAGARHVQGTINGYGERCGNANLCAIVPDLQLKMGFACVPAPSLATLFDLAHVVSEVANLVPDDFQPYVGRSAFAHKGGVHVAAIRRNVASYSHIEPELVGNTTRSVVSELSGRANVATLAAEHGIEAAGADLGDVLEAVKRAEANGYAYEAAEASVALLLAARNPDWVPPFALSDYKVMVGQRGDGAPWAEATLRLDVRGRVEHVAGAGDGPVAALDEALRKALEPHYSVVRRVQLVDYKVRILNGSAGTDAITRVLIESRDDHRTWSTVGASGNIIDASWRALADGFAYAILQSEGVP
jgi:2-isopropylmalate synthase